MATLAINGIDEERVLSEVMVASRTLMESFKFQLRYFSKVGESQEKKTARLLKDYRNKNWKTALSKAKGNKRLAYRFYTENIRNLF